MGWGTGNIGSGSGCLNFKVIGGTSAPTSPKENMIWVPTDVDITSWIFSATEPTAAEEGMVWIATGTSSNVEFNALKKNGIQVYPISAKQMVSGALVEKTAKSYQNGEWVEWVTNQYLFKAGEGAKVEFANNSESKGIINITNGYIEITNKASSVARAVITTKDKISTAGKSSLVAEVILTEITNSVYPLALCVTNKPYAIGVYDIVASAELKTTGSSVQTIEIPLDALSGGEYYFALTGTVKAKVQNWYMR